MKLIRSAGSRPIPAGTHPATVTAAEESESRSGNPMIVLTFETVGDREIKAWVPLHVGFRVDQVIDAFGTDDDEIDTNDMVGMPCRIEVKHEKFDGKTQAKVEAILPQGDDDDDLPF